MFTRLIVGVSLLLTIGTGPAPAQECLHGPNEVAAQRIRRQAAIRVVQQINAAQTRIVGPRTSPYRPLEQLSNIPPTPAGFRLQFTTDGATYAVSLKDTLDPCGYAIFSDQDKSIYEGHPRTGGAILPLVTQ
jgi:hypothetical protein